MDAKSKSGAIPAERFNDETTVDLSSYLEVQGKPAVGATDFAFASAEAADLANEADIILIAHPEDKMLGNRFRLLPGACLEIGRSSRVDISFPDVRSLSRIHAKVYHRRDGVEVEDQGSTNGTYVNDQLVRGRHVLHSGDRFQVGGVHFNLLHERDPEHAYHEAIHQLVVCDGLTQAYNQKRFHEELERELIRAKRHNRPLTLMLFDIDHFKGVNDTYGHLCGDYVLQEIARRIRERLGPEQLFARVGGEEFAILSPELELSGAADFAEELRALIAEDPFIYSGTRLMLTCSFGVAALASSMNTPAHLYEAADRAMYRAKGEGRNRVEIAEST